MKKTQERKGVGGVTFSHVLSAFEERDGMFAEFFPRGWKRRFEFERGWCPEVTHKGRTRRIDIIDHEDVVLTGSELPGVDKKDLDVSLTGEPKRSLAFN